MSVKINKIVAQALAVTTISICASQVLSPSSAFAIDKIYSPNVEGGEVEIETRGTYTFDDRDEKDGEYKQKIGFGYGFTDRFAGEFYGEIEDGPGEDLEFSAVEAEGRYQLFEQGEYWLDAGVYFATEYEIEDEEWKMEGKLLLEKPVSEFTNTLNLILEREVFGSESEEFEGEIAWKTKYRLNEEIEPGVEWHSELGELDDMGSFDEQEHFVGPAIYGKIAGNVKYELAYLFGVSDEAPDGTIRWTLELEL